MTRRWPAVLVTVLVLMAACGVDAEDQSRTVTLPDPVDPTASEAETPEDDPADAVAATVYLVDNDGLLHPASRSIPATDDPAVHLTAVVNAVIDGPSGAEVATDLRSAIPVSVELNSINVSDGVAAVDVSRAFESVGGPEELLATAQLVLTVTAVPGVDAVRLLLDGVPSRLPMPGGSLVTEPVVRASYLELLAS